MLLGWCNIYIDLKSSWSLSLLPPVPCALLVFHDFTVLHFVSWGGNQCPEGQNILLESKKTGRSCTCICFSLFLRSGSKACLYSPPIFNLKTLKMFRIFFLQCQFKRKDNLFTSFCWQLWEGFPIPQKGGLYPASISKERGRRAKCAVEHGEATKFGLLHKVYN